MMLAGLLGVLAAQMVTVSVRVLDASGQAVHGARVELRDAITGSTVRKLSSSDGLAVFPANAATAYDVSVTSSGFAARRITVRTTDLSTTADVRLSPEVLIQQIEVTSGRILGTPEEWDRLPGSISVLHASTLQESRVFSTDEALRKVSGVNARSEEGFGLRPNIGIRGLNPTRSTRVLLLEDGLPLSYAPYGDNASYYHPPVDRFDSIEVVKGGGQIVYGPMTVGGVVNYITPPIPDRRSGSVTLMGGNRDFFNGHLRYGGRIGATGLLLDAMRKQGDGSRENTRHELTDFNLKSTSSLTQRQTLGLRFNYYAEDSNLTYSGLRQDEWDRNPRGNPFRNDYFYIDRFGASAAHAWAPSNGWLVSTDAYTSVFNRNWWRQSSNSAQRPNDAADPACGGMINLSTTCGNEGRLRSYVTWGVAPGVRANHRWFGVSSESSFGGRYHAEEQERHQKNGPLPASRDGVLVENNDRSARAWSGFWQNRFLLNRLTLTPGLRVERVAYRRVNFLANQGLGVRGDYSLVQWIPGLGAAYSIDGRWTVFAGVHRGFAPPRVEDVVSNNTGAAIELDPELSWNWEAGFRGRLPRDVQFEAAWFRMDFSNQIIPASVAGGLGATLTNAGRTLHEGAEVSGRYSWRSIGGSRHSAAIQGAFTYLPNARFQGRRFSSIPGFTAMPIEGNRLPYAPRSLLTASVSYSHARGLNLIIEQVYTGRQFGDDLNSVAGTPDGQRGLIPGNALWNATLNYPVERWRMEFFVTTKNMLDRLSIVDRTRGLLPAMPRLVQAGIRYSF